MSETREARLRAQEMLRLAANLIAEFCPDATVFYDEAHCDGACVAEDCRAAADDLAEAPPEPPAPEPERRVGCEGEDGLLRVHAEADSCDVCAEPERPAARCVWDEDTSWRRTFISRCELTTNFAKRDMQGWRVCPYCGQPLSVEEDTHAGE